MAWSTFAKIAAGAAALFVGYEIFKPKMRFPGDAAIVGDAVHVPVSAIGVGTLAQAVPPGIGFVSIQVQQATPDALTGPVVGLLVSENPLVLADLPAPAGVLTVPRASVTQVLRGTQRVA